MGIINVVVSKCWSGLMMLLLLSHMGVSNAQLSSRFYDMGPSTCRRVRSIVRGQMITAVTAEPRMGASLLRLHFSDCFVNGCDASVLLDDTAEFTGEQTAGQNNNTLRGFEVIDNIKARFEASCPGIVSCADILALAAMESVAILGGPRWAVLLGRRDSTTASLSDANSQIPSHESDLDALISAFASKGFTPREMVALSGGHTIGMTRCSTVRNRIYNEANIDPGTAAARRQVCPASGGDDTLMPLDNTTPETFDNDYFTNLVAQRGQLHSDQQLFNGGSTDSIVQEYNTNSGTFRTDFAAAMVKMSELSVLTGTNGEVRTNCRRIN